ncbi:hypothetical protein ACFOMD_00445 [Sphingoaurantiacus capsulatus]|uniref:PEGA domain-containing protein n=1 Tax=Sphingoaurantiacus capsulatus TaxID=1771310 RepID=A0ABV7X4D1_9SPHN
MRTVDVAMLAAACGLLPGCATVVRGTHQDVSIVSEPPAALAKLSNGMSCTTPCKLELHRKKSVDVTISKPGYHPAEAEIVSKVRGSDYVLGIGGNFLIGGLVGAVVDGANGASRSLEPSPLHVELRRWGEPAPQATGAAKKATPARQIVASATVAGAAPAAAPAPAVGTPPCEGMPGVPAGLSSYAIDNGRGGFMFICDDPSTRPASRRR